MYAVNTFFILCTPSWLNRLYIYISFPRDNTCSHSNNLEGKSRIAKNETDIDTSSTAEGLTIYLLRTPNFHSLLLSLSTNVNCLHRTRISHIHSYSVSVSKIELASPCRKYLISGNADLSLLPYLNNCVRTEKNFN